MIALLYIAPLFISFAIYEWNWGKKQNKNWSSSLYWRNLRIGIFAFASQQIYKPIYLFFYHWIETHYAIHHFDAHSPVVWTCTLLISDMTFYWWHRLSHTLPFLWGGHAIHHTSPDYNLGLTFRISFIGPLYMLIFHTPLAFIGVPVQIMVTGTVISTLWQSWIHTESIQRIPLLEEVFVTPSSHAVHHATNPIYQGKNFGATLIIWDRLFGTHQRMTEKASYIQKKDLTTQNVWNSNVYFYKKAYFPKKSELDFKASS